MKRELDFLEFVAIKINASSEIYDKMSVSLSVYMCIVSMCIYLSVCPSICLFVQLSVSQPVCLENETRSALTKRCVRYKYTAKFLGKILQNIS